MVTELSLLACATGIDGEVGERAGAGGGGGELGTGSCEKGAGGYLEPLPLCAV